MKKLLQVLSILLILTSAQCRKKNPDPDPTPTPTPTPTVKISVTVTGVVLDDSGNPVSGATVVSYGITATTTEDGSYELKNVSMPLHGGVVKASAMITGPWSNIRVAIPNSKTKMAHADFMVSEPLATFTIENATGGKTTLANGTELSFPVNFAVNDDGTAYTGQVRVSMEYLSPYDLHFRQFAPGSMLKIDTSNNFEYLKDNYGMVQVVLKGATNQNLKLGTGIKAHLKILIPTQIQSTATANVPMLFLDEASGFWKLDGKQGTKIGNYYEADVDHFTWWTFSSLGCSKLLNLTVADANGVPMVGMDVKLINLSNNQPAPLLGYTYGSGVAWGKVPCNTPLKAEITVCGTVYSQNINPVNVDPTNATASFTIPTTQMITLKGKFVDCNGIPLSFGQGAINYNFSTHTWNNSYGNTMVNKTLIDGNNGTFNYSIPVCSFPQQVKLYTGWNNVNFSDSIIITVTQSGVVDYGNVKVCNTPPTYYFKWKVDSDPMHTITDSLSILSYVGGPPPNQKIQIGGKSSSNFEGYLIVFGSGGGTNDSCYAGLLNWGGSNGNEYYNIHGNDIKVNFTQFGPNSGDLISGTFSGNSINGVPHTVTGSFYFKRP